MASIYDSYELRSSDAIAVGDEDQQLASLALTAADAIPVSLSGYVYDSVEGVTPLDAATVIVYNQDNTIVSAALTEPSGYYEINSLAAGSYHVIASKTGYAPSAVADVILSDSSLMENFTLQLASGAAASSVYGIVTGTDDAAVAGAVVTILDSSETLVAATLTAEDGSYAAPSLANGTYTVQVKATGYAQASREAEISDAAPFAPADFSLTAYTPPSAAASISGFITTADDSAPIDAAWVGLYAVNAGAQTLIASTVTTAEGYYIFDNVTMGDYVVKSKAMTVS